MFRIALRARELPKLPPVCLGKRIAITNSIRLVSSGPERSTSKLWETADKAVADIQSGSTILSAGFGLCGTPGLLPQLPNIRALIGYRNLNWRSSQTGCGKPQQLNRSVKQCWSIWRWWAIAARILWAARQSYHFLSRQQQEAGAKVPIGSDCYRAMSSRDFGGKNQGRRSWHPCLFHPYRKP